MSIINAFPLNLQNGTVEDASQVMALFAWVQAQTNGGACPSTSGGIVLKGDGSGGTSPAIPDIDYASPASSIPIGSIVDYAGGTLPNGYFPCDGRAVSRTGYALLFSKLGTIWGVGDGTTTFNIPNTGGRTAIFYGFGAGTGSGAGSGTVSSITVASSNGFSGTVVAPTTAAIITLSTSITGVLKGSAGALALALNSDLPVMSATVGGAVPTPPNNVDRYLRGDGTFAQLASPSILGTTTLDLLIGTNTTDATSSIAAAMKTAGGLAVAKKAYIGSDLWCFGDIYQQYSAPGIVVGSAVNNLDNTNSLSGSSFLASVGGSSAGDPSIQFFIGGLTAWSAGIDNSDGDKFKISNSLTLGANDFLTIDATSGNISFPAAAQRIMGDLSNTTISNRLLFKNSIANAGSNLGIIPSGTSTASSLQASNASDADNCTSFVFLCNSAVSSLNVVARGTGALKPISIQMGGIEAMGVSTGGVVTLANLTTPGGATFHTTNTALTNGGAAAIGTLTNAPVAGNPTKWIGINDNGTTRYIPTW